MPKQSRGFWICEVCDLMLDTFEEAQLHETECRRRPQAGWKRPLLPPNESQHYLTEPNQVACQNMELFGFDGDLYSSATSRKKFAGKLGLRCCFCREKFVVPDCVRSVGDNVRRLAEEHVGVCLSAPRSVCDLLRQATALRNKWKDEAGPSWHEEESNQRALTDFCLGRCQKLGVVDKDPENSGICLGGGDMGQPAAAEFSYPQNMPPIGSSPVATTPYTNPGAVNNSSSEPQSNQEAFGDSFEPMPLPLESHSQPRQPSPQPLYPDDSLPMQDYGGGGEFPFFQAPNGDWMCKYCSNTQPEYRAVNCIWSTPSKVPPTASYVDYHLSQCRDYHSRMNYDYFQGGSSHFSPPYMEPAAGYAPPSQQQSWNTQPPSHAPPAHAPSPSFLPYPPYPASQTQTGRFANTKPRQQVRYSEPRPMMAVRGDSSSEVMDLDTKRAMDYLVSNDRSDFDVNGNRLREDEKLVVDEDKLLLTDYFYWVMKQLRLVRFSEADRRTRGGKREKILVGYGGLQCCHCAHAPNARKFFWSNVDRLANSFAEIPAHILKCRQCPPSTKDALMQLKQQHPDQMSRLPRGSQKVFFRRMWRRLHDNDPQTTPDASTLREQGSPPRVEQQPRAASLKPLDTKPPPQEESPDKTAESDESVLLLERSASEAAKALTDVVLQAGQPSPSSRVLLSIPEDKEWLSDTDCYIRRQIELFCATRDDVQSAVSDYKYHVKEGQVGIRCIHCALASEAKKKAVAYPATISGMYDCVREFHSMHLEQCANVPPAVVSKLARRKGSKSLSSVLRKYYILSAQAMGLEDTDDGIRASGKSRPFGSQSAFSFSEGKSSLSEEMRMATGGMGGVSPVLDVSDDLSKKRKATEEPSGVPQPKKL